MTGLGLLPPRRLDQPGHGRATWALWARKEVARAAYLRMWFVALARLAGHWRRPDGLAGEGVGELFSRGWLVSCLLAGFVVG